MRSLLLSALDAAQQRGASYADARGVSRVEQRMVARSDAPPTLEDTPDRGVAVRARCDGAWGFAAAPALPEAVIEAAQRAVAQARASALLLHTPPPFLAAAPQQGTWRASCAEDPFGVALEERLAGLAALVQHARRQPEIAAAWAAVRFTREVRAFLSTEGADLEEHTCATGLLLGVRAQRGALRRDLAWPNGPGGHFAQAGYELLRGPGLQEVITRLAADARGLLDAPACPERVGPVILASAPAAHLLQATLGRQAALQGAWGPEALGRLRLGAAPVHVTADPTLIGGAGSCAWDAEGTLAEPLPLVRGGLLVGALSSRTAPAALGHPRSQGTLRAASWDAAPRLHPANLRLEPGADSLEALVSDTGEGLLLEEPLGWSADPALRSLRLACAAAWELRGGRRHRLLGGATLEGSAADLWSACDAIAGPGEWRLWGMAEALGAPTSRRLLTGYGAAPLRLQRARVRAGGL